MSALLTEARKMLKIVTAPKTRRLTTTSREIKTMSQKDLEQYDYIVVIDLYEDEYLQ